MKVSELTAKPPKILLYGDVGVGKTALALTLGEGTLVLDIDDGLLTGKNLKDEWADQRGSVDVLQFPEPTPHIKATAFMELKRAAIDLANKMRTNKTLYRAVILDSLSAMAERAVAQIMSNSGKLNQKIEIQHWGLAFEEIKQVISILRTLPVPFILIGHEQTKTIGTGEDAESKLELAVPGKNLASQLSRYFDEIWYMRARPAGGGKTKYSIQTRSNGIIPCRSRANIPDGTETGCGMWKLIEMCGYKPPEKTDGKEVSKG